MTMKRQSLNNNRRVLPFFWVMALMMLWPAVANAYQYNTLTQLSYTSADLARYKGAHLNINPNDVSFYITENIDFKEIYAPNTHLHITLANGAKLLIDQDAATAAMNVKSLSITGYGYMDIIGNDVALGLQGGKLEIKSTTVGITSRTGRAIVAKAGSELEINNSVVDIKAPSLAVDHWEQTFDYDITSFTIKGSQSHVTVKGSIEYVDNFTINGGWVSITSTPALLAVNVGDANLTGGKIRITQVGFNYNQGQVVGIFASRDANIAYCDVEIDAAGHYGIHAHNLTINNAKVKSYAPKGFAGIYGNKIVIQGDDENCQVRAVGGYDGIMAVSSVTIKNHYLMARGYGECGVEGASIYISLPPGGIYEVYGDYPFMALRGAGAPTFDLLRPCSIVGSLSASNTNSLYPDGCVIDHNTSDYYSKIFGTSTGKPYRGYVKIKQPHIYHITENLGVENYNLLGADNVETAHPGETKTFDFSALTPYANYENAVKTVKLYRKQYTTGGTGKQLVQTWTGTTMESLDWTFVDTDVPLDYWCEVSLDAYEGVLNTMRYRVVQGWNTAQPVKPVVILSSNNLRVTNARSDQEYIVVPEADWNTFLNDMTSPGGLLSGWWSNSVQPTSNESVYLVGMGTQGVVNHVVTRYKETPSTRPGSRFAQAEIFYGSTVYTQGISFNITAVGNNFVNPDFEGTLSTKLGGVLKVEATPLPANATDYMGVKGDLWTCTYMSSGEQPFLFYANQACTTPLDANTLYKTVYVKANREGYKWTLRAEPYSDIGATLQSAVQEINISDANGVFRPYKLIVNNGDTLVNYSNPVSGIPFEVVPANATLDGTVTVTYSTVVGPFPNVASQAARRPSFTVDMANRTINMTPGTQDMLSNHTYFFTVAHKVNGTTYGTGSLRVQVVRKPINSLNVSPEQVTLEPGASLPLEITSDLPEAWRQYVNETTCESSDEDVATVKWDWFNNKQTWFITATDDPGMVGATATITLTVNGVEATCDVTIAGEKYPLWIAGTQVTSANCEDVLDDGTVSYEGGSGGGVLTLKGATINGGIRSEIPTLTVDLRTSGITVNQGSRFNGENTYFTGDCLYKTSSSDNSAALIAKNLTVSDSVILRAWANPPGVEVENLSVVGDSACVQAYSYQAASMYVTGILDGTITRPAGAVLNPVTGWVATGPDNLDDYVTNSYVFVKGAQLETFLRGDVNGDGKVNVSDVTALINMILGVILKDEARADINGDGKVNVSDVTALINIILS